MDSRLPKLLLRVSALIIVCISCGCGGSDSVESANADVDKSAAAASTKAVMGASGTKPSLKAATRRPDEEWKDFEGRRYIGKVPYDVFFDHPLDVATDDQSGGRAKNRRPKLSPIGSMTPVPKTDHAAPKSNAGPSAATDWASFLPAHVLEAEVKSNRNFLKQTLQSVGKYNSSVTMIPVRAATIAVLAGIAIEHSEEVSWKEDAAYIRDVAASMNALPLQRGPKDQRRLFGLFENLDDILNRSHPPGLPEPDPKTSLANVAEMRMVMLRMDTAEQRLQTEVNESSFESRQDLVLREASILSGLVKAVTTESYGFADDPDFNKYAQHVAELGQAMRVAADAGDFDQFELNLSGMKDTCQDCHRDYKSN